MIGVTFLAIISHYFIIGFILKNRVTAFRELSKKYSLEHSFVNNSFFIPYGKVNSLRGSVNSHTIEISDESFTAETDKLVKDVAISSLVTYTPRKSYNMDTRIYLDGKNVTPDYSQKWIMYRNPFMQIKEIKEYLSKL